MPVLQIWRWVGEGVAHANDALADAVRVGVVGAVAQGGREDNEVVRIAAYDNFACGQAEDELRCAPEVVKDVSRGGGAEARGGGKAVALHSVYDLWLALEMPVLD